MIDDELCRLAVDQCLASLRIKREPHVLHRADLIFLAAPFFKTPGDDTAADFEKNRFVDTQKFKQILPQISLVGDFQEQGGAELSRIGNQLIIDRDLLANLVEVGDFFRPQHFLYLKDHGVAILENDRDLVAQRNPSYLLFFYNVLAKLLAHVLVSRESEDVVENNLVHEFYRDSFCEIAAASIPKELYS